MSSQQHQRPISGLVLFAAVVLALTSAVLTTEVLGRLDIGRRHVASADQAAANIRPSAELSPEDVVRHQLTALHAGGKEGIRQCYQFASPLNRAATGPFSRFEQMVQSPPYDVLLRATDSLVGDAVDWEGRAAVLVSVIDRTHSVHVFRFILSPQEQAPYEDCWMTDTVSMIGFR